MSQGEDDVHANAFRLDPHLLGCWLQSRDIVEHGKRIHLRSPMWRSVVQDQEPGRGRNNKGWRNVVVMVFDEVLASDPCGSLNSDSTAHAVVGIRRSTALEFKGYYFTDGSMHLEGSYLLAQSEATKSRTA